MISKRTIISGVVEGFAGPILVTSLASIGLYMINWWAGILLGITGIILGRLIAIAINRNAKEAIIIGMITSLLVFAGVTWVYWYIYQLRITESLTGLTATERAESFLEIIGMNADTKLGERLIEAYVNAGGKITKKLVRPMCTVTGGMFAGATIIVTALIGVPMLLLENKRKKEQEKQKKREIIRQELWEETKKKKRDEPKEIETKKITEEKITEVRKAIGSEKKVSIDWLKKITLYKEEVIIEIATKELGMRIENGTLVLKKE